MSATLNQIVAGVVANLGAISGVQALGFIPSAPTPPCIYVYPDETDFDETMGGHHVYRVTVQAMVANTSDEGSQASLNTMLDPTSATSVKKAIESDKTLGGLVDTLHVTKQTGYRLYEVPNVGRSMSSGQVIGAEWTVEIYT